MTDPFPPKGVSSAIWQEISPDHLWAARHLADLAQQEEERGEVGAQHEGYQRHRTYVTGSLLSSVCYLEAAINELLSGIDEHGDMVLGVACDPLHRQVLARLWSPKIERLSMLEKYDLALDAGLRPGFDKGAGPYQDVVLVTKLRNALVHYKPEWVYGADGAALPVDQQHKFERTLKRRFEENPLAGERFPFWPDLCLSAGCARWAAESAEGFFKSFRELMDPRPR
jgi:hypothetical protein